MKKRTTTYSLRSNLQRCLILLLAASGLVAFHQPANPPECTQSLSYDLEEQRYYVLADWADIPNLTELDKVKFRKSIESKHVDICFDSEGEIRLETTLLNPEVVYEDWMTKVTRTVVDKDGVKMFNPSGEIVSNEPRGDLSQLFYNEGKAGAEQFGIGTIPSFLPLNPQQIQFLQEEGFTVQSLPTGVGLTKENQEIFYDHQNKSIEVSKYEEGELKNTALKKYKVNAVGAVEPDFFVNKTRKTLYSGICVDYVVFQRYSNYQRSVTLRGGGAITPEAENAAPFERRFEELDEDHLFNGLVSFGSPHQGAKILNNVPMISQLAVEGCQALAAGPESEISPVFKFALKVFTSVDDIQDIIDNACTTVGEDILPVAFNDYTADITNDYFVGSPYIEELNEFNSTMHKIAFWGDETEEPLIWHTISSRDPMEVLDNPTNFPVFGADDETLPAKAEEARLWYQSKVEEWEANSNAYLPWGVQCDTWYEWFTSPTFCALMELPLFGVDADEAIEAYQQGLDWLSFEANDGYKVIIGARVFENVSISNCVCSVTNPISGATFSMPMNNVTTLEDCTDLSNGEMECGMQTYNSFQPVEKQSDGVVLAESAMNLPFATALPVKMEDNNHMEMRNSPETMSVLLGLFNSGWGDPYFITLER